MAVGARGVDPPTRKVGGHHSEPLDRVDDEPSPGGMHDRGQLSQVGAPAVGRLHPTEGDHGGRRAGGDRLGKTVERYFIDDHSRSRSMSQGYAADANSRWGMTHPVPRSPLQPPGDVG